MTGVERPGYEIAVQKIEIIHPDGTTQTMVETSTEGESKTWDFAYLRVCSVLLPSWSSNGKDGPVNMERRLASYREAHAVLDREIAGEKRAVQSPNGFAIGTTDPDGVVNYIAVECDVLPAALKQDAGLYISTALLTLIVLLFLSAKLSKQVTVPVETLCREVEEGKCSEDGPIQELNVLASAFNDAQKKLEGQMEREREFTRSAAHELKTPLQSISGYAELIESGMAQGEQAKTFAAEIHKSANRLLTLINDIIRLSQMDAPMPDLKFEPVDLAQIAANTFEQLEMSARKADVTLQLDAKPAMVEADRQMMDELLYNLCDNAIRYNVHGGSVKLEVRPVRDKVIVCVQDTGIGISPENQEHVFERFYRVDKSRSKATGGTGLGLAIVKHIAVKHNAQIELESELGRGTKISVIFERCFKG